MGAFDRVKAQVASDSKWTSAPYKGFVAGSPSNTYIDIVSTAFEDATNTMNFARHSKYDEMYSPYLGSFRERHNYTSIAPSLCINKTITVPPHGIIPAVYNIETGYDQNVPQETTGVQKTVKLIFVLVILTVLLVGFVFAILSVTRLTKK